MSLVRAMNENSWSKGPSNLSTKSTIIAGIKKETLIVCSEKKLYKTILMIHKDLIIKVKNLSKI